MLKKIKNWYAGQNDTVKAFIWIGLVCIVGIVLRWDYIVEKATKAFQFYSK